MEKRQNKPGVSLGVSRDRRAKVQADVRKERRMMLTKRRRGLEAPEAEGTCEDLGKEALELTLMSLRNRDEKSCYNLHVLRRALCSSDPPIQQIVDGGTVPVLTQLLRFSTDEKIKSEAVWCLTNIATGDHAQTGAVLAAVPELLTVIAGASDSLREQACWTIGNIAGDSDEYRSVLIANGALSAILEFLRSTLQTNSVSVSSGEASTGTLEATYTRAQTAAWALSNLARGKTPAGVFVKAGATPLLLSLMSYHDAVATEVWWVFSFLSAKENDSVEALMQNGIFEALENSLVKLDPSAMTSIPIIRTLGNLVTGPIEWLDALLVRPGILAALLRVMSDYRAGEKAVMKESMYVLGSILGGSDQHRATALQAHAVECVEKFLTSDVFDLQKEATWALCNASKEVEVLRRLQLDSAAPMRHTLIGLLRVPDGQLACSCIQILKAVAFVDTTQLKRLTEEYLAYDMYEALEHILFVGCCSQLSAAAQQAIDELFERDEEDYENELDLQGSVATVFKF